MPRFWVRSYILFYPLLVPIRPAEDSVEETNDPKDKIANLLELFQQLEQVRSQSKTLDTFRDHLDATQKAMEYVLSFKQRLADIFQDPEAAFNKFAALAQSQGIDAAAHDMTKNPDNYGMLKGWSFGPVNNPARAGILKLSLPAAIRSATQGFQAHFKTGGGGITREELLRKVESAKQKMKEVEAEVGSYGKRIELELKIAELAREISFRDLANLPKEQYRFIESLRDKYRTLINTMDADPARRIAAAKKKAES